MSVVLFVGACCGKAPRVSPGCRAGIRGSFLESATQVRFLSTGYSKCVRRIAPVFSKRGHDMRSKKRWPDTPPLHSDNLSKAASESGGVLIRTRLALPPGQNGGCGAPTRVVGTNGGTMPCGAFLNDGQKRQPYYCAACSAAFLRKGGVRQALLNQ